MAEELTVDVVTPERFLLSEPANSVAIPGTLGEFEVLPGHLPMLASMKAGTMFLRNDEGEQAYAVSAGFVEVLPDRVIVLAETAEYEGEIDIERAREAAKRAADRLSELGHESTETALIMQTALDRARARIAAWEHRHDD